MRLFTIPLIYIFPFYMLLFYPISLTAPLLNAYILFYLHHLLHHRTLHHQQSQYSSHSANLYNNTKLVCTTLHQLIYHHIFIFCRYRYTVIFSFCSMKSYLQIRQNINLLHSVTTLKSCENKYFKKVLQIKKHLIFIRI